MKKLAFAAMVICLGLYGWTVWYERSLRVGDPFGYRNLKECPKIAPGATETDLVARLGAPERSVEDGGVRRLTFHTHSAASAPIGADVEPSSGKVLELRCPGDGTPTWTLRR